MVPMGLVDASGGTGRTLPRHWFAAESISPSGRGSKWALAGHSFAPRELGRRRPNLRAEIEDAVAGACEGLYRLRPWRRHPERRRCRVPHGRLGVIEQA